MKKIIFVLTTALLLGAGTMNAQNKFKAVQNGKKTETTTATPAKTTEKPAAKATEKSAGGKAFEVKSASASKTKLDATPATKAAPEKTAVKATATAAKAKTAPAKPKAAAPKPSDPGFFNGTWANSYSDGIGGMVTDYLDLTVDTATGTAKGMYKDENGDGRAVSGKLVGTKLILKYDADGKIQKVENK